MSEVTKQQLRAQARSHYHNYIADFALYGRHSYRLARRSEQFLVRSVLIVSQARPTKAELLTAFSQLIEEVEAEWDESVTLPPRPHDL